MLFIPVKAINLNVILLKYGDCLLSALMALNTLATFFIYFDSECKMC